MSKKIINHLFSYATQKQADQVIIENAAKTLACHYHLPGGEKQSFTLPKKLTENLSDSLRQILNIAPGELTTNKYCKVLDKNYQLSFYLTILPDKLGEKIIIQIINKPEKQRRLKQLGLQTRDLKKIKDALSKLSGLIIISSPAGGGRSTTLRALLAELDLDRLNGYFFEPGSKNRLATLNCLKFNETNWEKVINQDSNLLIFDDLESETVLKKAVWAAATRRLVLLTVTADNVFEVVLKILKLALPLKLKLDSLKMIINQRIVKLKRSGTAKRPGTQEIGLFEILTFTPELKALILKAEAEKSKNKFWEKFGALALKQGFSPLSSDRQRKIKDGLIS